MFKKKALLIILLIFIVSLTAVSAENVNDTISADESQDVLSEAVIDETIGNESSSIIAEDVVDDITFTAAFLDKQGNPMTDENYEVLFYIYDSDDNYVYDFWSHTDANGTASVTKALNIGNYSVWITNFCTDETQKYGWNITKTDETRCVTIIAYQEECDLIISALDSENKTVTSGYFNVDGNFMELDEDGYVSFNLFSLHNIDEYPKNLSITYTGNEYYDANITFPAELNNTIIANNVSGENSFNATILDSSQNPIKRSVSFAITNDDSTIYVYADSDENGFASISPALNPGNYTVTVYNYVTGQYSNFWWNFTRKIDNRTSTINATLKDYNLLFNVLNESGDVIEHGLVRIFNEDEEIDYYYLYDNETLSYRIYELGEGSYNITLKYEDTDYIYFESNASLSADIMDTIKVNSTFENTSVCSLQTFDYNGNPSENVNITFFINYEIIGEAVTGSDGVLEYDFNLMPGTYEITARNEASGQTKTFLITITEIDDNKKALIDVARDNFKFTINASDINGNAIKSGNIIVMKDDYEYDRVEIINATATFVYNPYRDANETYTVNLTFVLDNSSYYHVNKSVSFDAVNTIVAEDYVAEPVFNATFYDMDGNPLADTEVTFSIVSTRYEPYEIHELIANVTKTTDENGTAFVELLEGPYAYSITTVNPATFQEITSTWIYKVDPEITPIAEKIDDNPNHLKITKDTLEFRFPLPVNSTVSIDGDIESFEEIRNGIFTVKFPEYGTYNITVHFHGSLLYNEKIENYTVVYAEKVSDIINVNDLEKYFKGPERLSLNVTDSKGNPLANATVIISINGMNYTRTTDENGTAGMAINLGVGNYTAFVSLKNDTSVNATSAITVKTTIEGNDLTKIERSAEPYYADFRDSNGTLLSEGRVEFNINGVMYYRYITNGRSQLNINLRAGTYIITATNPVTGQMASNTITVKERIINNSDVTKFFKNATQYYVTVLDDEGNPAENATNVTFNINGVMYTRQTNENGTARLNINLNAGEYIITAMYKGCMVSNNITVLPILSAEDINMTYKDGTQFAATLVDGEGKAYANQNVTFNINGVFYDRETDENGTARLNINLMAGEYIITSMYNGFAIANTITIKSQ